METTATAVLSTPILIALILALYIFRKSIFTWAHVAEEKSHIVAKTIEADMLIQAGKLLDTLENYAGTIATIDDIDQVIDIKREESKLKREAKARARREA